jgi:hypothetical protein
LNGGAAEGQPGVPRPLPRARLKVHPPDGSSSPSPVGPAADAIELGYVPMQHVTRTGATTASWYRGPLLPYPLGSDPNRALQFFRTQQGSTVPVVFDADTLVRFDPSTGLFDVTYAAAWQLGRLLALQDKSFSISLYQWKRANASAAANALEQQVIEETFGDILQQLQAGSADALTPKKFLLEATLNALIERRRQRNR